MGTPALAWPGPPEAPGLPWLKRGHLTYGMAFPGCHMGPFLRGLGRLLVSVDMLTPWSQLCSALLSDCPTAHLPALFPVGRWPSSPPVQKRCLPRPPSSPVKVSRIGGRVTGPPHIGQMVLQSQVTFPPTSHCSAPSWHSEPQATFILAHLWCDWVGWLRLSPCLWPVPLSAQALV